MKVKLADGVVIHFNFIIERKKKGNHTTRCELKNAKDKDTLLAYGIAKCNSIDKYDQIMGKVKALDRALCWKFPRVTHREYRMKIWYRFFETLQGTDKAIQKILIPNGNRVIWDNLRWNEKDKKK